MKGSTRPARLGCVLLAVRGTSDASAARTVPNSLEPS
jgi:hypothetical protein